jgi:hypothetical protein
LKEWEPGQFAAVVAHMERRHGLKTLLIGSRPEQPLLAEVRRRAAIEGASPGVWVGEPSDLTTLVGLIAQARLFVGNDTGPMHLAAAVGLPVVARFGGGHWRAGAPEPRFQPLAPRAIVLTRALECFGCGWECWLGHAACMSLVSLADVVEAVDRLLASGPPERRVVPGPPLPEAAALLVRQGARAWRAQAQRLRDIEANGEARLAQIVELAARLAEREADRASHLTQIQDLAAIVHDLEIDREERMRAVGELTSRLGAAEIEVHDRTARVSELTTRVAEIEADRAARVSELTASVAEIEADRAARLDQILTLNAMVQELRARLAELDRTLTVRVSRRLGLIRTAR